LPNAQILGNLGGGFVKVTAGSGVLTSTNNSTIQTVDLGANVVTTANMAVTTVTPGTYGSASQVGTFTVGVDGRLTAAASVPITSDTMQGTYAQSVQPQIVTTTALGSVQFKRGSTADSDPVFQVLNGAGTANMSVTGAGTVVAVSYIGGWFGTTIPANKGGTGFSSYVVGDTLYADTTSTLAKLGIGATGTILKVVAGIPAWSATGAPFGGFTLGTAITGTITLTNANANQLLNVKNAAPYNITLPLASSMASGDMIALQFEQTSNAVTIILQGGELLDGVSSQTYNQFDAVLLRPSSVSGWTTLSDHQQTLPAIRGGTGRASYAPGDILYASSSTALSRVLIGAAGQSLIVSGGIPAWGTPAASSVPDYFSYTYFGGV
jgi:hypothetical protein